MKKRIIITNNASVLAQHYPNCDIQYANVKFMDVLYKARNMVHEGYIMLSHPLCGSLKPNETPYKSILFTSQKQAHHDAFSLEVIEYAIQKAEKFLLKERTIPEKSLHDFQLIDRYLLESALNSDV